MYDEPTRAIALAAISAGESLNPIGKRLGISRSTLRDWRDRPVHPESGRGCFRCGGGSLETSYAPYIRAARRIGYRYAYPRYLFSNESVDIQHLCQRALDLLGIPWRMPRPNMRSVARRDGVAAMDGFVGPKS
ncbi:helix-turn-helix domain-containing protein [Kribbella sp. NPDC048915]|uniref:helix-turn-helix domain-containing protein n=1 Tax=Kribbella sp. NPDC048915 TaxID=3155148 RepID=UPI0033F8A801